VASWMMNLFLAGASKVQESTRSAEAQSAAKRQPKEEDATQKVAGSLAEVAKGKPLSRQEKEMGGSIRPLRVRWLGGRTVRRHCGVLGDVADGIGVCVRVGPIRGRG
jgi:hypothetical protein